MESAKSAFVEDRIAYAKNCIAQAIKRQKPDFRDDLRHQTGFIFKHSGDHILVSFDIVQNIFPADYMALFEQTYSDVQRQKKSYTYTLLEKSDDGRPIVHIRWKGKLLQSSRSWIDQQYFFHSKTDSSYTFINSSKDSDKFYKKYSKILCDDVIATNEIDYYHFFPETDRFGQIVGTKITRVFCFKFNGNLLVKNKGYDDITKDTIKLTIMLQKKFLDNKGLRLKKLSDFKSTQLHQSQIVVQPQENQISQSIKSINYSLISDSVIVNEQNQKSHSYSELCIEDENFQFNNSRSTQPNTNFLTKSKDNQRHICGAAQFDPDASYFYNESNSFIESDKKEEEVFVDGKSIIKIDDSGFPKDILTPKILHELGEQVFCEGKSGILVDQSGFGVEGQDDEQDVIFGQGKSVMVTDESGFGDEVSVVEKDNVFVLGRSKMVIDQSGFGDEASVVKKDDVFVLGQSKMVMDESGFGDEAPVVEKDDVFVLGKSRIVQDDSGFDFEYDQQPVQTSSPDYGTYNFEPLLTSNFQENTLLFSVEDNRADDLLQSDDNSALRCCQCNLVLRQNTRSIFWMCALCTDHNFCVKCESNYESDHFLTKIRTNAQLQLFQLITPQYRGELKNRFDFKRQQESWVIQNTGKTVWPVSALSLKVDFRQPKALSYEFQTAVQNLFKIVTNCGLLKQTSSSSISRLTDSRQSCTTISTQFSEWDTIAPDSQLEITIVFEDYYSCVSQFQNEAVIESLSLQLELGGESFSSVINLVTIQEIDSEKWRWICTKQRPTQRILQQPEEETIEDLETQFEQVYKDHENRDMLFDFFCVAFEKSKNFGIINKILIESNHDLEATFSKLVEQQPTND